MSTNTFNKVLIGAALLGLSACGLFGKEPLNIDGERIDVIRQNAALAPDFAAGEVRIKLPSPYTNPKWNQSGGNSLHLMGHLQAGAKLKEQWSHDFGAGSSKRDYLIAEPIIAYKVVFAADADGIVTARRLDNGKPIWRKRLKAPNKLDRETSLKVAGLAEYNKSIFATTGFGSVFCLDMRTGKEIWRTDLNIPLRIAPTVNAGRLLAQGFDNTLFVLDTETGAILWKNKTDYENTTLVGGAAPAYSPGADVIIAAFSNGELRAFKASTGTPLWADMLVSHRRNNSLSDITAIKANPVIDGGIVFAVGYNSVLAAIDLRTGDRLWERELGSTNQPWVAGNYLFVLTNDFELVAFDKRNGKIVWTTPLPKGDEDDSLNGVFAKGPILADNRLLVTTSNGYIYSVSPYNGAVLNYISADDGIELPPVMADGVAIFATLDADMTAYK